MMTWAVAVVATEAVVLAWMPLLVLSSAVCLGLGVALLALWGAVV